MNVGVLFKKNTWWQQHCSYLMGFWRDFSKPQGRGNFWTHNTKLALNFRLTRGDYLHHVSMQRHAGEQWILLLLWLLVLLCARQGSNRVKMSQNSDCGTFFYRPSIKENILSCSLNVYKSSIYTHIYIYIYILYSSQQFNSLLNMVINPRCTPCPPPQLPPHRCHPPHCSPVLSLRKRRLT